MLKGSWSTQVAAACALAVLTGASATAAHGGATGITGVAAADAEGPRVVAVSEGFAERTDTGFRFVCPALFGSEPTPPALSVDGVRTFVVGEEDLFVLEPGGSVSPLGRPDLSRRFVIGLLEAGGRLHAVRFHDGNFELVALDEPAGEPLWRDVGPYDSLSADGDAVWAARVRDKRGAALRIELDGTVTGEVAIPVDTGEVIAWVGSVDGALHAVLRSPEFRGRLVRLGADGGAGVLLDARWPVVGPVTSADASGWAAGDGVLHRLAGAGPAAPAGSVPVGCLGRIGGLAFVCSRTRLFALEPDGPGALLVDLEHLIPPDLEQMAPAVKKERCLGEWDVFRDDLEAIGAIAPAEAGSPILQAEEPSSHSSSASGCTAARSAGAPKGTAAHALLALGWVAFRSRLRARGRRAGRCPSEVLFQRALLRRGGCVGKTA